MTGPTAGPVYRGTTFRRAPRDRLMPVLVAACALAGLCRAISPATGDQTGRQPMSADLQAMTTRVLSQRGSTRATEYTLSNKIVTFGHRTHVAWLDTVSEIMVATQDHRTGEWTAPTHVGSGRDNHGGPALTCDSRGYLHIIFGPHGGAFQHCRSAAPNDATQWVRLPDFGENATYPSVVCDDADTLHIVYRGGPVPPKLIYQRRPAGGEWSRPRVIAHVPGTGPAYTHFGATLVVGPQWSLHMGYHFYYQGTTYSDGYLVSRDRGDTWCLAKGATPALPIAPDAEAFFTHCPKGSNDLSGLAVDGEGLPWVTLWRPDVVLELWHYDGERWVSCLPYRLTSPPIDFADLVPGHYPIATDPQGRIYVALTVGGQATVLRSSDRGKTFERLRLAPAAPDGPHQGFNFERPTGHNVVGVPWLLFRTGSSGEDCEGEGLLNRVTAVQFGPAE